LYEEFTFLDTVTGRKIIFNYLSVSTTQLNIAGHTQIKNVINSISTPPEDIKVEFKNVDGSMLKVATIKFFPYKQFILNSLLMVVCDLNVEDFKIRIDADRDVIGMGVCLCNDVEFL